MCPLQPATSDRSREVHLQVSGLAHPVLLAMNARALADEGALPAVLPSEINQFRDGHALLKLLSRQSNCRYKYY